MSKEIKKTEDKNPRRSFIKKLGIAMGAAGTVSASGMLSSCSADTQEAGDKVKVLTQDGKLVEVDVNSMSLALGEENDELLSEYQERGRQGITGKKWVMVIDLARCQNARKCMEACQSAHELRPEQHHINVLEMQDTKDTAPYYMPKPCYHCDNPPCTKVCPVNATFKREDGIVLIDNERCIGCRFCIAACPYSARMFQWFEPNMSEEDKMRTYDIELNVPQKKGTITKCIFSADQLRKGKLPYCVSACPNGVYYFGDKNEDSVTNGTSGETVRFSELIRDNAGYTMHEEFGTKPQVFYLPAKNRRVPFAQAKEQSEKA
ncbi:MAG: 4Fe-4S dicluster domain-containing protein [Bacteroidota bacterium]|nr:4Fe-4S dicluster domain-containing protein [Bacteroidota bacterium]